MSATNTLENAILSLLFTATNFANVADNAATDPITDLYISLHTADPGEAGDQTTNETAYEGYARIEVERTTSGWTVSNGSCTNDAAIEYGQCTASPGDPITHVGVGTSVSGAGILLLSDPLSAEISMQLGTTPYFAAGQLALTCS